MMIMEVEGIFEEIPGDEIVDGRCEERTNIERISSFMGSLIMSKGISEVVNIVDAFEAGSKLLREDVVGIHSGEGR